MSLLGKISGSGSVEELLILLQSATVVDLLALADFVTREVIATNFVGVPETELSSTWLTAAFARKELSFDLNVPFFKARSLAFLFVAKVIADSCTDALTSLIDGRLALFRIYALWQAVLPEPSAHLKELIEATANPISSAIEDGSSGLSSDRQCQYLLERAQCYLTYFEYDNCGDAIQKAMKACGIELELGGRLGKRTHFQVKEIAQLVLRTTTTSASVLNEDDDLPTNCALNDDTIMDKIKFAQENGEGDGQAPCLTPLQLCAILAACQYERRSQHFDELQAERCSTYVNEVVSHRRCWPVQTAALLLRSSLEKRNGRRVERACSQAEVIARLMDGTTPDATLDEVKRKRVDLVLASGLQPFWAAETIHAEILVSLGCTSEALLIYERMEMWDEVIECYKGLKQLEKAESLIRRLIEERPNDSMLFCYLGDITLATEYFEKAITISNDRNARARRSLGHLLLMRNQYESAYEHLKRSIELQPIQLGACFNAGHCAWKLERYSESASYYHRCVSLEPDHFEAWNNLSAAYIRQGQKERARRILQEALKYNYEHPKVWENYLLLCVDTGEYGQAIQAFHRLLDLNKSQRDEEVLLILAGEAAKQCEKATTDEERTAAVELREDVAKLLARAAASQSLSGKLWRAYALLRKPSSEGADLSEFEKFVQLLEKACAADANDRNWPKSDESTIAVFEGVFLLCDERSELAERSGKEETIKQMKAKNRMQLRTLITLADKEWSQKEAPETVANTISVAKERLQTYL